ncbi:ATP-binding cassette domain-containing protein [Amycolatopsis sp. CA-230715]|uniref:ATP-binding cassette domain-containing protein n=1 Tax=Amycolatopsis sp. CA-230715 TaxID=2745196 RepID=UPI001C019F20|nr:ATP-binding cassette domain-containing protein [Amycolatopsis sp. CA-230715]QWF78764.1 ABC transporter ATP-binding protein YtrE [Amycolatopsis sp. CA-230715]
MNGTAAGIYFDSVRTAGRAAAVVESPLNGISLSLAAGSVTAVIGTEDGGAAALLRCVAGLERATEGSVRIGGTDLGLLGDDGLLALRRERIGVLGRSPMLVGALSVQENVELPLRLAGRALAATELAELLERTGLTAHRYERADSLPRALRHRVAFARALAISPAVIVADEPAAELDSAERRELFRLLRESGSTVLLASTDATATGFADSALFLADGKLTVAVP